MEIFGKKELEKLTKSEFIQLVDSSNLSERALASSLGVSRSYLTNHYKDCQFQSFEETRTCSVCGITWLHTIKSRRDSTKRCTQCKKAAMVAVNKAFIQGKPSHRRQSNRDPVTLDKIRNAIKGSNFVDIEPDSTDHWVNLVCACGNRVSISIKDASRKGISRKLSCGCESRRHSQPERSLISILGSLGINKEDLKINCRYDFLDGRELDIFIPSKKLAIEFHGLGFHSERNIFGNKDPYWVKTGHEFKYLHCKNAGINLIQIFEDELNSKPELIIAMLKSRLGLVTNKLSARDLTLKPVPSSEADVFFEENHIAGAVKAKIAFGLYREDELLVCLSLRNPWNKHYGDRCLEIARFASKSDHIVRGAFSRLLSRATFYAKDERFTQILTYADCRFGSGHVYLKSGFKHLGKTKPNYFYERAGIRESRFSHRKREDLPGATERDQQNALGWYAIYDAGSEVYLLDLE